MIKELPRDRAAFEAAKLAGELEHIRTSMVNQYISRKVDSVVQYYTGHYGHGYTVKLPNYNSSRFSYCQYWIYKARS
jgi:hypothetical protein